MNSEQVNALNRVLAHYGHDEMKHYREAGESPSVCDTLH